VRGQIGYDFMDMRRKRKDEVTWGDGKRARMEEVVPEVSTNRSIQEMRTVRKLVAFSDQRAKANAIENTTRKITKVPKAPRMNALALDTGKYEVLGSSPHVTLF